MKEQGSLVGVIVGVGVYIAILAVIILAARRWYRRRMAAQGAILSSALEQAGARHVRTGAVGGPYEGTDLEYEVKGRKVIVNNHSVSRYKYRSGVRIECGALPWVVLFPEGGIERFGKDIGINREVQTGDEAFDAATYIDTIEEEEVVKPLFEKADVRKAISALLSMGYQVQLSYQGVEAFQLIDHGNPPDVANIDGAIEQLSILADALPRPDPSTFKGKNRFGVAAALVGLLGWLPALVVAGLIDYLSGSAGERTLHGPMNGLVLVGGAAFACSVYVAVMAVWVRGRSYAFRTLIFSLLLSLIGYPLLGVEIAFAVNQGADSSPAELKTATISRTHRYKSDCRVVVSPIIEGHRDDFIGIPCRTMSSFKKDETVQIKLHRGALGVAWVEPLEPPR